ncbi:hypothetical protein EMIHUDRAFT_99249 [Emiliania huxleyi CCMP1516]|uniref:Major facilitator superfamily (MFS) profile domain-containing protein n=2 Tax=Emiliania huxleyi TaxID=2903 RepID=A0A0D3K5D6_EMIH1|nr:hypothetical protein EMIHUDRAFT_99249 [Emiliania huxleyi CCMP1516]EOD30971.1 hypothetical protein EMIHUDRAFT_99249 [Emiliania huxleyi CCMP1516]|eukprot:XP_005783400.1 hypothetical protein EMIHUDRAFT_99249 [Emiliania huxleyi CCMP1516]
MLGNMLEWLDFGIYGYSQSDISVQLFAGSETASWATFGLGYAFRPVGAFVLGKLSDAYSRKSSFLVAMLGMAFSTALMATIPAVCGEEGVTIDYCVGAVWKSAVPAVALRCVQGFSAGAAAGGINVIQSELWSTSDRKGALAQSVGVNNASGAAASMLSAAIVFGLRSVLGSETYAAWGWRLAFLAVVPPSMLASYLMHTSVPESNEFATTDDDVVVLKHNESIKNDVSDAVVNPAAPMRTTSVGPRLGSIYESSPKVPIPASTTMSRDPPWLVIVVSIYVQFAIAAYNNLNVSYAKEHYGVSVSTATLMQVVGKAVQVGMTPLAALLADLRGWYGACAFGGIMCSVLALPMMTASEFGGVISTWMLISVAFPIVSTVWILNAPLLATSIFPVETRSKGTSLVMATAAAISGFFPLALNEITNVYASGVVLAVVAALASCGILWLGRITALKHLVLHDNALSGSIPPLSGIPSLRYLQLSGNRLSGTIPPQLGDHLHLSSLDVSRNRLSGGIPAELANLRFCGMVSRFAPPRSDLCSLADPVAPGGEGNQFDCPVPPLPAPFQPAATFGGSSYSYGAGDANAWLAPKQASQPPPPPPPPPPLQGAVAAEFSTHESGRADFRGKHGQMYAFFSAPGLAVNVKTEDNPDASFLLNKNHHHLEVDGSFITEVHIVALVGGKKRKAANSQVATASFWASELSEFNTGWRVELAVRGNNVYGRLSGPAHRLDMSFTAADSDTAALAMPHGLIGQSFSAPARREGKVDDYPLEGHFATSAMAEGAVEGTPGLYEVSSPYATSEFTFSRFSQPLGEAVRPRGQHHGDRLALDENAVQCGAASEALTQCLRNHGLSLDPMLLVSEPSPQSDLCLPALHAYQRCGRDVLLVLELTRQGGCQAEVAAARRCNEAPSANCESAELAAMLCLQRGAASRPPD